MGISDREYPLSVGDGDHLNSTAVRTFAHGGSRRMGPSLAGQERPFAWLAGGSPPESVSFALAYARRSVA
jgi:hypothetical protein